MVAWFAVVVLVSCGTNEPSVRLLSEQKRLKDSVNRTNDIIGYYLRKGLVDSVELEKQHLGTLYQKLAAIQTEIDSRKNERK